MTNAALFAPEHKTHPPRILILYGSLRPRSFSRLSGEEAGRILTRLGAEVRLFNPSGLPLVDDGGDQQRQKVSFGHKAEKVTTKCNADHRPNSHQGHKSLVARQDRETVVQTVAGKAHQHRRQADGQRQAAREVQVDAE